MNKKSYGIYMFLCLFTIKVNGGAYEVCTSPNIRYLENQFQHVLQLAPGNESFGTRN